MKKKATEDLTVDGEFKTERISDCSQVTIPAAGLSVIHIRDAVSPRLLACHAFSAMIPQRGFATIYLIGGIALAALIGLGVIKWQSSRIDALQREKATIEASRDQWLAAANACSEATEKAAKEAEKRTRNAAIALKQARIGADTSKREAERLRGIMGAKTVTACPAGEAVAKVREGLK